ncbi:carbohydrate-binding module family 50 protein [Rhypophila decipiens]|uniref:Carbohydrate-binding module family 50 protein n=1 Tax=Rhypophila decipiens TaxID=261697 RepID=A0AAN6YFF5_9PEZI|nr:carbohydrate-binding module family 50 protein [Rhypophila decipiens]
MLYCIGDPTDAPAPLPTPPPACNLDGPQPQQAGIVEDCLAYWFLGPTDPCELIAEIHDVTEAQLIRWNPVLDSDCSGLESGYFVCVESTTTSQPPLTPTPPKQAWRPDAHTSTASAPATTCWDISVAAGISLQTIYTLNQGLGTECATLWSDYFICLATSETRPTPRTITSGPPINPTPQPVQAGIAPNCQRYYLVRSGDSCWDISVAISVPLNTFLSWNPALGQVCGGLWGAYYVCIGTGPPATTISSGPPLPT